VTPEKETGMEYKTRLKSGSTSMKEGISLFECRASLSRGIFFRSTFPSFLSPFSTQPIPQDPQMAFFSQPRAPPRNAGENTSVVWKRGLSLTIGIGAAPSKHAKRRAKEGNALKMSVFV